MSFIWTRLTASSCAMACVQAVSVPRTDVTGWQATRGTRGPWRSPTCGSRDAGGFVGLSEGGEDGGHFARGEHGGVEGEAEGFGGEGLVVPVAFEEDVLVVFLLGDVGGGVLGGEVEFGGD